MTQKPAKVKKDLLQRDIEAFFEELEKLPESKIVSVRDGCYVRAAIKSGLFVGYDVDADVGAMTPRHVRELAGMISDAFEEVYEVPGE